MSRIEKECFFAGLQDQSKYLVSHMKDKREYSPVDMLKELRENDEACIQPTQLIAPENRTAMAGMLAIGPKGVGLYSPSHQHGAVP